MTAAPDMGDRFTPALEDVAEDPAQVVLHYDFEDVSGGIARDQSGNGLNRLIVGTAGRRHESCARGAW